MTKRTPIDSTRRAAWLEAAYDAVRKDLLPEAPERGSVALVYSFPSRKVSKVLGQCHQSPLQGGQETCLILIAPRQWSDAIGVLAVLCHEMAHASLPAGTGHKAPFQYLVYRCGLEGKATATVPGLAFTEWATKALEKLPPFPAGALTTITTKVQGTRLRLWECPACGQKIRAASDTLDIQCNPCEENFVLREGSRASRKEQQPV